MSETWDSVDMSVVTLFAIGGAANFLAGALFLILPFVPHLMSVSIPSAATIATLYFLTGLACLWVARGIRHSSKRVPLVGVVVSLLNLLPPSWLMPSVTPWVWLVLGGSGITQFVSAAIGIACLAYFVARRSAFEVGVGVGTTRQ